MCPDLPAALRPLSRERAFPAHFLCLQLVHNKALFTLNKRERPPPTPHLRMPSLSHFQACSECEKDSHDFSRNITPLTAANNSGKEEDEGKKKKL